jgi:7,8-dihydropterin-6-yl-methyl-4-(beta-D-ribofuranosyl)aminobenzene 5'-phosphate synthase
MNQLKLTIVYDNNPLQKELQTDWGFSCLIETGEIKILFDTGDNEKILLDNMQQLGIDPQKIDIVFLSHFHNDHTGGLKKILEINPNVKVFYPQSFPDEIVDVIKNSGAELFPVAKYKEILPDIFTLGEIQGKIPEQSLVIKLQNKLIVITGCAHPGITGILEKVNVIFPDEPIDLALGGFHLHRFIEEEIKEVIQKIAGMNILNVAPTHCSGNTARQMFKKVFDEKYIEVGIGKTINLN